MTPSNSFDLTGKTAFVTGGLGLVGSAICRSLSACGARTFALDTENAVGNANAGDVSALVFDAADTERLNDRLATLESQNGHADIWVNSAYPRSDDWGASRQETQTADSWRENVDLQLNSYCLIGAEIAARMAERGGGSIVNLGSIYGLVAADFRVYEGTDMMLPPAYAAIKGGIVNYTRYLASFYGKSNVRVNVICPGGVADGQPEPFVSNYNARTPMGRMADADEIGGPVAFLASDAASYITGAVLAVDGGWTAI